jgi:hypothetical protein
LNLLNGDSKKNKKEKIKEIATGFPKKY